MKKSNTNKTTTNATTTNATTTNATTTNATGEKYALMLETARKLIKDNMTVKDATRSIRFSTAGFAVVYCKDFKSWDSYKRLFAQLKEDLKAEGVKYAGTPLSKACLAVSTAVIDCHLEIIEGKTIEDDITFVKDAFKKAGVCFSSKQGDIRIAFGCPTSGDLEKAQEELTAEVIRAVEFIEKAGTESAEGAIRCLQAFLEREAKVAATAEKIAKEKAA
jgi:hypothetical protein